MAEDPPVAVERVVCLDCMRDAEILFCQRDVARRGFLVRARCHDVDRLGWVGDRGLIDRPPLWCEIEDMFDPQGALEGLEADVVRAMERAAAIQAHLKAKVHE